MKLLDKINSPDDVKALGENELDNLCGEIREFLIEKVSKTGGHLSSNLGIVELTVGIHRVFDTSKDRLVFDVGHQCYVHKLLTGRKDGFDNLRKLNGMSGFPKPVESVHDAFVAGHASNSVSVALGMAKARTKLHEDSSVIALIGDGSLTGGLAYEGLENVGESNEPIIVILNDNGMSISKSVGGVAKHLSKLRTAPAYYNFKKGYRNVFNLTAIGRSVHGVLHSIKSHIKSAVYNCSMFEQMGFEYLGPVDGHCVRDVVNALENAKSMNCPVLVHVMTTKGKGYKYSEINPDKFHGISTFDPKTGQAKKSGENFSAVFGEKLTELAKKDETITAITAAMGSGTGLNRFAGEYPDRFFDMGITEEHSAAMSAGMAFRGLKPVFAVYSTFLQRSYDMLIHDVALTKSHVVFGVDRAGLVGADGETHHGVFDVGYLATVPHMTVYSPSSFAELRDMLEYAVMEMNTPVAVRYPRGGEGVYTDGGCEPSKIIRKGKDYTILSYGININDCIEAAEILSKNGISVELIKLGRIKPIEFGDVIASVKKTGRLMVVEECAEGGCVGMRTAAELMKNGIPAKLTLKNLGDGIVTAGTVGELRALYGIDSKSIVNTVMEDMKNG